MAARVVTVIGGSGFVGRYLVQKLAREGAYIRVAVRNPVKAEFLRPRGVVGQIVPVQCNLRHPDSVRAAVEGADEVVNLPGILFQSGRQTFKTVQADGPRVVAEAAGAAGVSRLIQMSAIGASETSPSEYARSKAFGEAAAREAFPETTIIRPSIVFGPEDGFFNRFASIARMSPFLPLIGGGLTRLQPVYVADVAQAMANALAEPKTAGKTYELGGPKVYTFRELMEYLLEVIERRRLLLPIPWAIAELQGAILEKLPAPVLTADQVKLLKTDNVVASGAKTLKDLGVAVTALEAIVPAYMVRFRKGGSYSTYRMAE